MITQKRSPESALRQGLQLPFALVRSYSQVTLGKTPPSVLLDEVLEAQFFDASREIRLFRQDGTLVAVELIQEESDRYIEETLPIEDPLFGSALTVRKLLAWDEDGQTYLAATRMVSWKGEE